MQESPTRSVAHLLDRLIFASLLVIIVATAFLYGTVQSWWISVFECAVFLTAILGVIESTIGKTWSLFDVSPFTPLLVLAAFSLVQSLFLFSGAAPAYPRTSLSADPHGTREFAVQFFSLILTAILLARYVSSKSRLQKVIFIVVGVGVASALFGIVRKSLPLPPFGDRGFAQFVNRNHFAFMAEMSFGLLLGLIAGQVRQRPKVLALLPVCGLLFVVNPYFETTRGAGLIAKSDCSNSAGGT